jgi:FlaA1/EpsC-like NDP-sugar epimerase
LITEGEGILPTSHGKIMVLKGVECELQTLNKAIKELVDLARDQDAEKIKDSLKNLIDEYQPSEAN